jgi:hypothetical protein
MKWGGVVKLLRGGEMTGFVGRFRRVAVASRLIKVKPPCLKFECKNSFLPCASTPAKKLSRLGLLRPFFQSTLRCKYV